VKSNQRQSWLWLIDVVLLAGFLAAFFLDLTGLSLHQWLGVALTVLAGYHLVLHWSWVKSVAARLFHQLTRQPRYRFAVDASLLLSFATIMVTGVVISTWLTLPLGGNYLVWRDVHVGASIASLAILVLKIGMHWRWIVNTAQRYLPAPRVPVPQTQTLAVQPVPVATRLSRRHFLALMGIVGASAALALSNLLDNPQRAQAEVPAALPTATPTASAPQPLGRGRNRGGSDGRSAPGASSSGSASSAAPAAQATPAPGNSGNGSSSTSTNCVVQCNRRCSYPGSCRRYVDRNNNGRCDLGECMSNSSAPSDSSTGKYF
jgi:hypothetical protein